MRITVAAVGKLKEKYWREAIAEYSKRLSAYCRLEIGEVTDEGYTEGLPVAEEEKIKQREWQKIARHLRADTYLVALDVQGEQVSSEELSARLDKLALDGHSDITFLIGGSLGLPAQALKQAHWRLSFSRMTFPHQLMRVVLLEQIYRAFKISRGEPYHK
ncbi:23S rRNA (pseudouridine(1915)-N(3))-methyltransferase RlmH [Desulfoscipio gibsoniae]|uniref:Ribosomal RNA large subunit methyltransferase H n=1 Tax=Desulfoscipio gibsoniae DSM 7213 TaxID=767817 RepID=R4KQT0_9FIRM|nr:23S rRNA (pseudouridine(1915)-N(3))-methyltransferase RlmH [Desulfoscipio gibsoniae]AGL03907.1 rRNA large subunit m3Psi methyltransferase RlmH [Desulfoscipio gibsoniae DSM 7213]